MLPLYLLALIPLALHCNIVNLQLAQGNWGAVAVVWLGLAGYYLALKYIAVDVGSYLACLAGMNTVMAAVQLAASRKITAESPEPADPPASRIRRSSPRCHISRV
jgi:uncharacterized membrane protein YccF (DUF307 family)